MNSQTARRPAPERSTRSNKNKSQRRQTAHVEARRDGKPLIFGWGSHLSFREKNEIRRRFILAAAALVAALVIGVVLFNWINLSLIVPNQPITSVNGTQIPQSQYKKMVALKTQLALNDLYGPNGYGTQQQNLSKQVSDQQKVATTAAKKVTDLQDQIKKAPADQQDSLKAQLKTAQTQQATEQQKFALLSQQSDTLGKTTIPFAQTNFTQSQVGNESAGWLQDDQLIQQWAQKQGGNVQGQINPTNSQVANALKNFQANLPKSGSHGTTYDKFLSQDHVSNDDVQSVLTIKTRRDNMQKYLASQVNTPTKQVQARAITVATEKDAKDIISQISKGSDFATLAKSKSVDSSTNTKGGDLGWMARGQYVQTNQAATVENWLFDANRKVRDLSPALSENGSFRVVQVTNIDPSRALTSDTLNTLKTNALNNWLVVQRSLPENKIVPIDQNMLLDASNMPSDLPAGSPSSQSGASGLPGGAGTGTGTGSSTGTGAGTGPGAQPKSIVSTDYSSFRAWVNCLRPTFFRKTFMPIAALPQFRIPTEPIETLLESVSLYLHIPFCHTRCHYCDFNTYAGMLPLREPYVKSLVKEVELMGIAARQADGSPRRARTIFFGGGTPSLLSTDQIGRLLQACRDAFAIDEDAEITLEANPGTLSKQQLVELRGLGVNRLSMGAQSFDAHLLEVLGRIHTPEEITLAVHFAREAGFKSINVDFMFGLPEQTMRHWQETLEQALALRPEHLSLYSLIVEEGTPFFDWANEGKIQPGDEDLCADMYEYADERLARAGYLNYEISNWSLPGQQCQHNLTYWLNLPYIGMGAGAHSFFRDRRFSNILLPLDYTKTLKNGTLPEAQGETIEREGQMSETAFLALRTAIGLHLPTFERRFNQSFSTFAGDRLRVVDEAGLLEQEDDWLRLSSRGRLLGNEVFLRLLPD